MIIEIIAIGNELLLGNTINSNATFLSKELSKKGYAVQRHTVLPDEESSFEKALEQAYHRSDIVLLTGGLGPTCDDITRKVLASFFKAKFVYSKEIEEDLLKRYGSKLSSIQDQATVLDKAIILRNKVGTAPGFLFHENNKLLASMPGVPLEMKAMFLDLVLPVIEKQFVQKEKIHTLTFYLGFLSENKVDPFLRKVKEKYPLIESGIYPGYGTLSVHFSGKDEKSLKEIEILFTKEYQRFIFSTSTERLEEVVLEEMRKKGFTLAIAESCTGGSVSSRLTSIAGASDVLLGSIVTYSNEWKKKFLHVKKETLESHGAVSCETVEEMLHGVLQESQADFALAVSGIAGPTGGSAEKPVGTVWLGICKRGEKPEVMLMRFPGQREPIILCSVYYLLSGLWRKVVFGGNGFEKDVL